MIKTLHSKENDPVYPKDHLYITRCLLKTSAMSLLKILRFLPGLLRVIRYCICTHKICVLLFQTDPMPHGVFRHRSYPVRTHLGYDCPPFYDRTACKPACSQYNIRLSSTTSFSSSPSWMALSTLCVLVNTLGLQSRNS